MKKIWFISCYEIIYSRDTHRNEIHGMTKIIYFIVWNNQSIKKKLQKKLVMLKPDFFPVLTKTQLTLVLWLKDISNHCSAELLLRKRNYWEEIQVKLTLLMLARVLWYIMLLTTRWRIFVWHQKVRARAFWVWFVYHFTIASARALFVYHTGDRLWG